MTTLKTTPIHASAPEQTRHGVIREPAFTYCKIIVFPVPVKHKAPSCHTSKIYCQNTIFSEHEIWKSRKEMLSLYV